MKKNRLIMLVGIFTLVLMVSAVSAQQNVTQTMALTTAAEAQVIGGNSCWKALGLFAGLALATLSPCEVLCAAAAWYELGLVAVYCG